MAAAGSEDAGVVMEVGVVAEVCVMTDVGAGAVLAPLVNRIMAMPDAARMRL
jgi:hypothetical protein